MLLALSLVTLGCAFGAGGSWDPRDAFTEWTPDDESEIGMKLDAELRKRVSVIDDPALAIFVNDLGQALVAGVEPQPFVYRFRVIAQPSINAFAMPGGYVYVNSGTILAATSVDELAALLGHEIAHVKARHHDRMRRASQLPDLLVGIAGLAATLATREPGIFLASQAVNVALQLRFSREYEVEADALGAMVTARAGFDPGGSVRFFERLIESSERQTVEVPPYLFTHPALEERVESARERAGSLAPAEPGSADWEPGFRNAQARLAMLLDAGRRTLPFEVPDSAPVQDDALLAEAVRLRAGAEPERALARLEEAGGTASRDPRVSFEIGEILSELGRPAQAAAAWRRTVELNPTRALVHYRLGLAYAEIGDRARAVFHFEQALERAGSRGIGDRARWELSKLTFGVVRASGLADGRRDAEAETPAGHACDGFRAEARVLAWWGRLSPPFAGSASELEVRWIDPSKRTVREARVETAGRGQAISLLESGSPLAVGDWTVEVRLRGDVVETRTFPVRE